MTDLNRLHRDLHATLAKFGQAPDPRCEVERSDSADSSRCDALPCGSRAEVKLCVNCESYVCRRVCDGVLLPDRGKSLARICGGHCGKNIAEPAAAGESGRQR
jgi:hypothetical protein